MSSTSPSHFISLFSRNRTIRFRDRGVIEIGTIELSHTVKPSTDMPMIGGRLDFVLCPPTPGSDVCGNKLSFEYLRGNRRARTSCGLTIQSKAELVFSRPARIFRTTDGIPRGYHRRAMVGKVAEIFSVGS